MLKRLIAAITGTCIFGDAPTFIKDCRVLFGDIFIVPFFCSAMALFCCRLAIRASSLGWLGDNKFWPLRYLFATLLVMYTMIVRWRNSLSALLLLKWITKSCWNSGESVSECKHICHCNRFIFCILLWVHHNSMVLTLRKKFICLTVLNTQLQSLSYSHRNSRQHFPSQWELSY